ncbi:MAG: cytidine deaminase [Prevotella sp.]|uniref:cytidine deaminase n=1 Tax=Prevotella sp. TaxID=59823 RepID=UPI002A30D739|nr:cytidine deaminase [Prevotella sp.]MDD7318071.1 cytidine deaminase [Prevotellaceae bacterium]MDY4021040.1 cytidine deaminase [Prevotella sp.]
MKEVKIESKIKICDMNELTSDEQRLIEKAKKATDNSYSPYSRFRVGAAIRLGDGTEIIGANQENAAFSVTVCAERSAIFAAMTQYPDQPITHLAIAARNENGFMAEPTAPCGSCRQVILEVENLHKQNIRMYLYGENHVYVIESIKDILPLNFDSESM